jgi:hypothetical protein
VFWFIIHSFGFFNILELHSLVKIENDPSYKNENMIIENTCEMFMNDVMEEECVQECEINVSLQTKSSQNLKTKKKLKNYQGC